MFEELGTAVLADADQLGFAVVFVSGVPFGGGLLPGGQRVIHRGGFPAVLCRGLHGLGLLIVRQIAQVHGGDMEVGHSARGGFAVRIRLPLTERKA